METPVSTQQIIEHLECGGHCDTCGAFLQSGECSYCSEESEPCERQCDCWISDGLDNPLLCPYHTGIAWIFDERGTYVTWKSLSRMGWTGLRTHRELERAIFACLPKPHSDLLSWLLNYFPSTPGRSIYVASEGLLADQIGLSCLHYDLDTHFKFTLEPSFLRTDFGPAFTRFALGQTLSLDGMVAIPMPMISSAEFKDCLIGERLNTQRLKDVFYVLLDQLLHLSLGLPAGFALANHCADSASKLKSRLGAKNFWMPSHSLTEISYSNPSRGFPRETATQIFGQRSHR